MLWAFGTLALPYASTFFHQVLAAPLLLVVCWAATAARIVPLAVALALLIGCQLTFALLVPALAWAADGPHRAAHSPI